MKEKELKIIEYYGVLAQLKHFQTEVWELNEAIINHRNIEDTVLTQSRIRQFRGHIVEEIADVQLMLDQFKQFYNVSDFEIDIIMQTKADRQLERIKKEQRS